MLTSDSIHIEAPAIPAVTADTLQKPTRPQTPYQVLRLLPKDATPEQQDSAIQAWFQPGEIHYSDQPDTLHLPGHGKGRSLKDVSLPQYYRENYFSEDSLYHPELEAGRYGVAGDPVGYTIGSDDLFSSILLTCFVFTMLSIAAARNFFAQEFKKLIYIPKNDASSNATATEMRALCFFTIQTAVLLAILYFQYVKAFVADTFILSEEKLVVGIYLAIILGYFILKLSVSSVVSTTFFKSKKNKQWIFASLFLTALEGGLLYPAVLLLAYFNTASQSVTNYCLAVVILVKMVAFYKCYVIFFRQNGLFLQIFLYFCALEIVPLFALWGGLEVMTNALKINF